MAGDPVDLVIRRAIGGDADAISWIEAQADTTAEPILVVMAALLEGDAGRLDRALLVARTVRDRQVVAIADAHLRRHHDLVDALARDHLVDHPDSYVVAWIASDALGAR
jgi:hypothetical protein